MNYFEKNKQDDVIVIVNYAEAASPYAKQAAAMLDQSIFSFQKEKLMTRIDAALAAGNREEFQALSEEYKSLVERFQHLS